MNDWPPHRNSPDIELQLADRLIDKADALLRRHRVADTPHAPAAHDDDLPILTEVVTDFDEGAATVLSLDAGPAPAAPGDAKVDRAQLVEHLVRIDTLIAREVETWLTNELPQLLSRELDSLSERLRVETLAHLRATLLPTLSDHIASRLDELDR